jgi:hypothetical protein
LQNAHAAVEARALQPGRKQHSQGMGATVGMQHRWDTGNARHVDGVTEVQAQQWGHGVGGTWAAVAVALHDKRTVWAGHGHNSQDVEGVVKAWAHCAERALGSQGVGATWLGQGQPAGAGWMWAGQARCRQDADQPG